MIFRETKLQGAFVVEAERVEDDRGFFARTFCAKEFESRGLHSCCVQCSTSYSQRKGTLRGIHYQAAPHEEIMLVRCTAGSIYAVMLDLRRGMPTYRHWDAVELTSQNGLLLYIPRGVADGYQTLLDNTEVLFQMSEFYQPESQRGIRYNDPAFGVRWPLSNVILSPRDQGFLDFGC